MSLRTFFFLSVLLVQVAISQTVNTTYLNPNFIDADFKYLRFGNATNFYAGFMWNDTSSIYGDGDDFTILTYGGRDITFRPGSGNVIFFPSSGGNVGIGTSSPGAKLDVNGSVNGTEYITVSKGGSYRVGMNGQTNGYIIGRNDNVENKFQIHSNGNTWFNGGNVGIGTTSPDAKLAVNGNIHVKEVKVDLTGWPDYVFEKDHDLPTLEEVEKHIQEKGHLINIPSAKEVEENGIQLGEMNKLLLEKIEELTLYTLEQEKKLKAQNSKIKEENKKMIELENRLKKIERLLNQD